MASANLCNSRSPSSKTRSSLQGPVAIFWDIENCPVPSDVHPEDVAGNIRLALQTHLIIDGAITGFSAYGDFNAFPRRLREGCQRTGVKLIDVPNGRKDAADKAIFIDMFLFALDNCPPSSIVLISGDVDFAPVLHILGQRGYTVILVIPSGVGISSALSNAGRFLLDWPNMARGNEFVPQPKITSPHADNSGFRCGCRTNETIRTPCNEEGTIEYKGNYNTNDSFMISESTTSRLQTSSSGLNEVSTTPALSDQKKVHPGDLNQLKGQLLKLLELSGGYLLLSQIHAKYLTTFGRPLCIAEYGASKLEDLLRKMSDMLTDTLTVEGEVLKMCVCNSKFTQDSFGLHKASATTPVSGNQKKVKPGDLNHLKGQLMKLLELSGGHLQLGQINGQYLKAYGRPLCMAEYGVSKLKDLLGKMTDKLTIEGNVLKACVCNSKFSPDSSSLNKVSATTPASGQKKAKAGDLNHLKGQLVELLELSGGHLLLSQIHAQYLKTYERPLCTAEYGIGKLKDLLGKMTDKLTIEGEILKKCVCNSKFSPDSSGLNKVSAMPPASGHQKKVKPGDLNHLKGQLVKLLKLSGGRLLLSQIHGQYLKTYGRPLCMAEYGTSKLKDLLGKMADKLTITGEVGTGTEEVCL